MFGFSKITVDSEIPIRRLNFRDLKKANTMSFVMYSTSWCGYCKRLKSQLADLGVTFEEINIEEVEGTAEIVEKVNGGNRTVPTLVFSDGAAMTNPSAKQVVDKLAELKG
jgi:mycoredoxin